MPLAHENVSGDNEWHQKYLRLSVSSGSKFSRAEGFDCTHNSSELKRRCLDGEVLTLVDSWLLRLSTWSRASCSSRFSLRISCACRSSAFPYRELPPDSKEAALPWTETETEWQSCINLLLSLHLKKPIKYWVKVPFKLFFYHEYNYIFNGFVYMT